MSTTLNIGELLNLVGLSTGVVLYVMLLAMVQETDPAVRYTAADGLDHTAMHLLGGTRLGSR